MCRGTKHPLNERTVPDRPAARHRGHGATQLIDDADVAGDPAEDRQSRRHEVRRHPVGIDLDRAGRRTGSRRELTEEALDDDRREHGVSGPEERRLAGCPHLHGAVHAEGRRQQRLQPRSERGRRHPTARGRLDEGVAVVRDPDARAGLPRHDELCGPHELVGQDGRDPDAAIADRQHGAGTEPPQTRRRRAEDRLAVGERGDACPVGRRDERREGRGIDGGRIDRDPIRGRRIVDELAGRAPGSAEPYVVLRDDRRRGDLVHPVDPARESGRQPPRDPDEEGRGRRGLRHGDDLGARGQLGGTCARLEGDGHRRAGQEADAGDGGDHAPSPHHGEALVIDAAMSTSTPSPTSPCSDRVEPPASHSRSASLGVQRPVVVPIETST